MTNKQINIAIAEACGWWISESLTGWQHKTEDGAPPDYLNDLNAMHEAEESLNHLQQCEFAEKLFRVMIGEDGVSEFMKIHSTAAQRAEAFLRTIGKWEEQP